MHKETLSIWHRSALATASQIIKLGFENIISKAN